MVGAPFRRGQVGIGAVEGPLRSPYDRSPGSISVGRNAAAIGVVVLPAGVIPLYQLTSAPNISLYERRV